MKRYAVLIGLLLSHCAPAHAQAEHWLLGREIKPPQRETAAPERKDEQERRGQMSPTPRRLRSTVP